MKSPIQKSTETPDEPTSQSQILFWLKRLGVMGFLFFLAKGLMWLLVPILLAKGC